MICPVRWWRDDETRYLPRGALQARITMPGPQRLQFLVGRYFMMLNSDPELAQEIASEILRALRWPRLTLIP